MKRSSLTTNLKAGLLAVPAAAMMLGSSHAAQLGINFANAQGYVAGPTAVTATAFGIGTNNWFTTSTVDNEKGTNVIALAGGGSVTLAWSAANTWNAANTAAIPGDEEVTFGILDDGGSMWRVTLSGLRSFASDCTIQLIAATSASQSSFPDATLTATTPATQTLDYTNGVYTLIDGGTASTSTVSTAYSMVSGNNTISMTAGPRDSRRSSLAGLILTYTPGNNAPLVEADPQAPGGLLFPGDPFSLSASASGSPTLAYQWRKDGSPLAGATNATYNVASAVVGDTGSYDVVVTNAFGADTSAVAGVTIQAVTPPVITTAPLSQSLYQGYPVTFNVAATGGQLTYQWKSNTVAIADATNTSYTISSITTNDAGTYTIEVNNTVGPVASASATLTVNVPTGEYETAVVGTKPALWFRYSETEPKPVDTANNSGSLGATGNGLYIGSATHPVPGALVGSSDTAAALSGGKVSVPYHASLNPSGAFTVDCWIKPTSGSGTGCIVQSMINGENPGNTNDRTGWALRQNGTGLRFLLGDTTGSPFYYYYTTANDLITAGVWQHVTVVYNDVVPTIYINGVLAATTVTRQDNVAITQPEIDALRITPNFAAPLIVGDRGYGGWTFAGSVDEVAVYGSELTSGQIAGHYDNGTNASPSPAYNTLVTGDGAVAYLRLNEAALIPPLMNSGTLGVAFDGMYAGDIAPNTVGPRPTAQPGLEADNIAVAMTNGFATSPTLPLNTNTVTVACWLKPETVPTGGDIGWPAFLGLGNSSGATGMHIENSSGRPQRELRYHWRGEKWGWGSGLIVPADTWTFCVMVVEPDKATIYMSNGDTLLSSVNDTTHAALDLASAPGFGGNQSAARTFIGGIDETTVYNRALTQSEITTLFLVGTGAPFQMGIAPGGFIEDTNPASPLHPGSNLGTTWTNSSSDGLVTRTGVEVFTATNATQIVTPAAPDFNSTTGTFAFWMRTADYFDPTPGPGNEAAMFMDRRTDAGTVITMDTLGGVFVQCAGGANTLWDTSLLSDESWHHVAVTYDQSLPGGIEIFVDGVSTISQTNSAAWSWPATQPIELGRSHDGYWYRYDGEMDDFRFYDRILTPAEISAIYTSNALVDAGALKLRYNFDTAGIGWKVTYPFGTLESTPTLNPPDWQPVPGATPPDYPTPAIDPAEFFRATP